MVDGEEETVKQPQPDLTGITKELISDPEERQHALSQCKSLTFKNRILKRGDFSKQTFFFPLYQVFSKSDG